MGTVLHNTMSAEEQFRSVSAEDWKEMYGNLDNFIHPEAATGKAVVRQDIAAPAFNKSILEERQMDEPELVRYMAGMELERERASQAHKNNFQTPEDRAQTRRERVDARLADAEAVINEEWRMAEEEGRQTKLRAEALEAKRQEEAMRADEAQAQEEMLHQQELQIQAEEAARVAAREQEYASHVKLVEAENATRIAAGNNSDAQAAHVEAVNTRDQAMDNRANMHGQNHQQAMHTRIANEAAYQQHYQVETAAWLTHEQDLMMQREANLRKAQEAQAWLQEHEYRQAEQQKFEWDQQLYNKEQREVEERAVRMNNLRNQQLEYAQGLQEKEEKEQYNREVRLNPAAVVAQYKRDQFHIPSMLQMNASHNLSTNMAGLRF